MLPFHINLELQAKTLLERMRGRRVSEKRVSNINKRLKSSSECCNAYYKISETRPAAESSYRYEKFS